MGVNLPGIGVNYAGILNQWRIIFKWNHGNAEHVAIVDYH